MSVTGIDIAWARPSISEIKATGAKWVARYFSNDSTKNWTEAEVKDYPANGLACVGVWETTTSRATDGRAAGQADARTADAQRKAVGFPADMPIYFAVDEDTDWASVQGYAQGFIDVLGKARVGVYGGFRIIEGAHGYGIPYLWQTVAWSGGQWSSHASIRQPADTTLNGDADFDYAEVTDFGQYPRPSSTPTPPGGTDLPTPFDVWAYKGPGDAPDVHQTLQNIANEVTTIKTVVADLVAVKAELDTVKAAVATAIADLDALTKAGSATAAEVEAGVQAELVKLGQALGGIK